MANKNLRELIQDISENMELEGFKIEDVPETELPENFNTEFHNKYLTLVAAKNNPELMGHFKGKYLSSNDLSLKKGFIAAGGTEEIFNELKTKEPDSLKLVGVVFDKVAELKAPEPQPTDDKAFKAYKEKTALEISGYKNQIETSKTDSDKLLNESNGAWSKRFTESKVNEKLGGQNFDSTLDKTDVMYLINRKIDNSNYLVKLQDDFSFKVFNRDNPDTESIIDGKYVSLDDVINEFSEQYTKKNDQPISTDKPQVQRVTVQTDASANGNGKYIPGHPDYNQ